MEFNEFREENDIIDPNVARSMKNQSSTTKRKVTPSEMGFVNEEKPKQEYPEQQILDDLDKVIKRKRNEALLMAQAIEESDGEGITEEEFQDLLVQAKDQLDEDDGIPLEEEVNTQHNMMPNKVTEFTSTLPEENPAQNLLDELEEEIRQDEEDYREEVKDESVEESYEELPSTSNTKSDTDSTNNIFKNFESGDINFDEENDDLDVNVDEKKLAEKEQKDQLDKLKKLVKEKISPVTKVFDISSYSISQRPAANVVSTPRDNGEKVADWVLMSSQKPIYMRKFSGTEIERLLNGGKGRTRLNRELDKWQLIYNHIVDPHKPETLEQWAKTTSFLDIDHIYMAIYRANFEGSNYIPYNCTDRTNCKEVFLSDNIDIMDLCKFAKKEDKDRFYSILGSETNSTNTLYSTEVVPVSDEYAFVFREPSIYNIIFESAVLEEDFIEKFGDLVSICAYIDGIYSIDHATRTLQPVRTNVYPNNMKKTVKSRIINFSKYISNLGSDQYNTIIAYMQKINESGDALTYQLPEVTCPKCKTVIPATTQEAQGLVFTRHQLAALATL